MARKPTIQKPPEEPDITSDENTSIRNPDETISIRHDVKYRVADEVDGENPSTHRLQTIDQVFDKLFDKVKFLPEARQIVLRAAIEQLKQISEQLKRVRDIEQLHELKKTMLQKWNELNDLTQDQPELLEQIQNWGQEFIDQNVVFYDTVNVKKEDLVEKAGEIEDTWVNIQSTLGKISGIAAGRMLVAEIDVSLTSIHSTFRDIDVWRHGCGMEDLLNLLSKAETGLEGDDTPVSNAAKDFRYIFTELIRNITTWAYTKTPIVVEGETKGLKHPDFVSARPIDHFPELQSLLDSLQADYKKIAGHFRKIATIFHVLKKIRDTHFLPLYNEIPIQKAA